MSVFPRIRHMYDSSAVKALITVCELERPELLSIFGMQDRHRRLKCIALR